MSRFSAETRPGWMNHFHRRTNSTSRRDSVPPLPEHWLPESAPPSVKAPLKTRGGLRSRTGVWIAVAVGLLILIVGLSAGLGVLNQQRRNNSTLASQQNSNVSATSPAASVSMPRVILASISTVLPSTTLLFISSSPTTASTVIVASTSSSEVMAPRQTSVSRSAQTSAAPTSSPSPVEASQSPTAINNNDAQDTNEFSERAQTRSRTATTTSSTSISTSTKAVPTVPVTSSMILTTKRRTTTSAAEPITSTKAVPTVPVTSSMIRTTNRRTTTSAAEPITSTSTTSPATAASTSPSAYTTSEYWTKTYSGVATHFPGSQLSTSALACGDSYTSPSTTHFAALCANTYDTFPGAAGIVNMNRNPVCGPFVAGRKDLNGEWTTKGNGVDYVVVGGDGELNCVGTEEVRCHIPFKVSITLGSVTVSDVLIVDRNQGLEPSPCEAGDVDVSDSVYRLLAGTSISDTNEGLSSALQGVTWEWVG